MSKKRATVEGNIRKRKDVLWEGRYTARYDQTGKRIIKNVLGKTHKPVSYTHLDVYKRQPIAIS